MKANRIHRFGPPDVIAFEDAGASAVSPDTLLVRVEASGVGPWDAWIRTGTSKRVRVEDLPITLGSDIAGIVTAVGPGVCAFVPGDEVFGVTNRQFTGGNAQYALATCATMARKPRSLAFADAASVPVIAVTALQMLQDHARLARGQTVLVLGAPGNVGAFAVQLARSRGLRVIATGGPGEVERLERLGASRVIDVRSRAADLHDVTVDAVIDTVGGPLQRQALASLKPGGVFVSAVSELDAAACQRPDVRSVYFIVDVTTRRLDAVAGLIDAGELQPHVGVVLALADAHIAHEMLDGVRPRPAGKIVLRADGPTG
ncbi:MAG: putative zinc-binding oxidoreductase [Rhizobacter sp.]|nr:putative zinc-binding oxidoreductase [Rhizobacter sp.]